MDNEEDKDKEKDNDNDKDKDKSKDIIKDKDKGKDKKERKKSEKSTDKTYDSKRSKSSRKSKSSKSKKERKNVKIDDESEDESTQKNASASYYPSRVWFDSKLKQQNKFPNLFEREKVCLKHKINFDLFCDTCEEPICQQCVADGPHFSFMHRISNLEDSFHRRIYKLKNSIDKKLKEKEMLIRAQMFRVNYRMEEIQQVGNIIEKDIQSEQGAMLERLYIRQTTKIFNLQNQLEILQSEFYSVNGLRERFLELIRQPANTLYLLRQSIRLCQIAEYHANKPLKCNITYLGGQITFQHLK